MDLSADTRVSFEAEHPTPRTPHIWEAALAPTGSDSDHVYKVIELVGTSATSVDDAIKTAISRASKTLKHLRWFEVIQTRGHIENGQVGHYQVTLKVGFTLE
jgi:flavin-binding protein dodecin